MAQSSEPKDIFTELKEIREQKQISLQAISKDSRIQLRYLEAIESGEFEKIPEVYDKLFFQTYLSYLQLEDPQPYLEAYKRKRKAMFHPTPTTTLQKILVRNTPGHPVFNLKTLFFGGPILIIIVLVGFLIWNSRGVETDRKAVRELPVRKIAEELDRQEKPANEAVVATDSLIVQLTARDTTWLRFIKDLRDTSEVTLWSGNRYRIEADSFVSFLVGNAAGIAFTVNGDSLGILGEPGEVITYLGINSKGVTSIRKKTAVKKTGTAATVASDTTENNDQ